MQEGFLEPTCEQKPLQGQRVGNTLHVQEEPQAQCVRPESQKLQADQRMGQPLPCECDSVNGLGSPVHTRVKTQRASGTYREKTF